MKKKILIFLAIIICLLVVIRLLIVHFEQKAEQSYHNNIPKTITLWSLDFTRNGEIPSDFTMKGNNYSPSLFWTNLPPGTRSIVLVVVDYDAPAPFLKLTTIDHWIIYNINPIITHLDRASNCRQLAQNGMRFGENISGGIEYVGPNPPIGTHKYYFRIYALSVPFINLEKPTKKILMEEMKANILAYGELIGTR